ncbi:MAG: DUF2062 domain-containing protein [Gammaproteobacteria bacterium]|nr:DUF2062 domain-containing protein [Gammaproteobacteria bacterium]
MNNFFSRGKRAQPLISAEEIESHRGFKWLGRYLKHPYLWKFDKVAVARAAFIGLFVASLPIPFQMLLACIMAINFRANLPSTIGLTWISNPLTSTPLAYLAYKLGQGLLKTANLDFTALSYHQILAQWHIIWPALLLGSLFMGLVAGTAAWMLVHLFWCFIKRSQS